MENADNRIMLTYYHIARSYRLHSGLHYIQTTNVSNKSDNIILRCIIEDLLWMRNNSVNACASGLGRNRIEMAMVRCIDWQWSISNVRYVRSYITTQCTHTQSHDLVWANVSDSDHCNMWSLALYWCSAQTLNSFVWGEQRKAHNASSEKEVLIFLEYGLSRISRQPIFYPPS